MKDNGSKGQGPGHTFASHRPTFLNPALVVVSFMCTFLLVVVNTNVDCLECLGFGMDCYVSNGTLNTAQLLILRHPLVLVLTFLQYYSFQKCPMWALGLLE